MCPVVYLRVYTDVHRCVPQVIHRYAPLCTSGMLTVVYLGYAHRCVPRDVHRCEPRDIHRCEPRVGPLPGCYSQGVIFPFGRYTTVHILFGSLHTAGPWPPVPHNVALLGFPAPTNVGRLIMSDSQKPRV